jgi:hypothetical protein
MILLGGKENRRLPGYLPHAGGGGGPIISYRVHQTDYAGLPSWMHLLPVANGVILHGTPAQGDVGRVNLMVGTGQAYRCMLHLSTTLSLYPQVSVLNSNYQAGRTSVQLTVQPVPGKLDHTKVILV